MNQILITEKNATQTCVIFITFLVKNIHLQTFLINWLVIIRISVFQLYKRFQFFC